MQKADTKDLIVEVAYHLDKDKNIFICDIIIFAKYRKQGFGATALNLLCNAAKENGVKELYDNIAINNPSISLFLKNGFNIEYKTETIIMVKKVL